MFKQQYAVSLLRIRTPAPHSVPLSQVLPKEGVNAFETVGLRGYVKWSLMGTPSLAVHAPEIGVCTSLIEAARESTVAGVPIHVLGVGYSSDKLNQLAVEGGMKGAFIVNPRDPNKVGDDLARYLQTFAPSLVASLPFLKPPGRSNSTLRRFT
jgi:hypothetical protein